MRKNDLTSHNNEKPSCNSLLLVGLIMKLSRMNIS